ncbi:hypothetical protein K470DRAFT_260242 [Piedraia hortae CBS 480.64]|uniref:Uncharacterized protein n=1 Tax=Piedraia hortae CBS 480.64 TaxID=1314780 RepID=A0A6A7BRV9_9PEZI|nr:hypothetical protein K470DRAFT_260242 [Piedraia hortae CBS 480.64]
MTLKIPKTVGPSADYYSIAVQDISKDNNPVTFSNKFHLDGADGNYTDYENKLGGAMFWDPNTLPCDSYDCARKCAMDNYPQDLNDKSAQGKMDACILKCPGVSMSDEVTNSQNGTDSSDAVVTITSGVVMTAIETTATTGGSTITEAVLGSNTLVLGGPAATISGEAVSLASGGVVVGKETAAFSGATESGAAATSGGSDGSAKESGAAAPSQSGKGDKKSDASKVVIAGGISLAAFVGALIVV